MICKPCRERKHKKCPGLTKGPTWCDCQHRTDVPKVADNQNRK